MQRPQCGAETPDERHAGPHCAVAAARCVARGQERVALEVEVGGAAPADPSLPPENAK